MNEWQFPSKQMMHCWCGEDGVGAVGADGTRPDAGTWSSSRVGSGLVVPGPRRIGCGTYEARALSRFATTRGEPSSLRGRPFIHDMPALRRAICARFFSAATARLRTVSGLPSFGGRGMPPCGRAKRKRNHRMCGCERITECASGRGRKWKTRKLDRLGNASRRLSK